MCVDVCARAASPITITVPAAKDIEQQQQQQQNIRPIFAGEVIFMITSLFTD
jgi:hypothetical protein